MGIYYLDTSAILKRYVSEPGSAWVDALCTARDSEGDIKSHQFVLGEIARVEVAAALTKKSVKTKEISVIESAEAYKLFLAHLEDEYQVVSITSERIRAAAALARTHALRAYDAIQLALAMHANDLLKENGLGLIFVTGDKTLLQAAQDEGLTTDNPHDHP
ncbi:MAG: type II toxin-antitoxin system VapC family toxin [Chloroflexi bacterium]|nr:type II toxin-antitoxin system VapC family toxin [Chloroflexota bacterium]